MRLFGSLFILLVAVIVCRNTDAQQNHEAETSLPPGTIVDVSPDFQKVYIGSPSIAVLKNGTYVASHDWFGPGTDYNTTAILVSFDKGKTWERQTEIRNQWWSNLFVHSGDLYIMGTTSRYGHLAIRRSTDGGRTWTEPKDADSGLLRADARYHTAPCPVKIHNGRIWRAVEDAMAPGGWGKTLPCRRPFGTCRCGSSEGGELDRLGTACLRSRQLAGQRMARRQHRHHSRRGSGGSIARRGRRGR